MTIGAFPRKGFCRKNPKDLSRKGIILLCLILYYPIPCKEIKLIGFVALIKFIYNNILNSNTRRKTHIISKLNF